MEKRDKKNGIKWENNKAMKGKRDTLGFNLSKIFFFS